MSQDISCNTIRCGPNGDTSIQCTATITSTNFQRNPSRKKHENVVNLLSQRVIFILSPTVPVNYFCQRTKRTMVLTDWRQQKTGLQVTILTPVWFQMDNFGSRVLWWLTNNALFISFCGRTWRHQIWHNFETDCIDSSLYLAKYPWSVGWNNDNVLLEKRNRVFCGHIVHLSYLRVLELCLYCNHGTEASQSHVTIRYFVKLHVEKNICSMEIIYLSVFIRV